MKQTTVSRNRTAFLLMALAILLSVSGLAALAALAGPSSATAAAPAPTLGSFGPNPELRLLQPFTGGLPADTSTPPSCAAQGGVCFPILDAGQSVAT
jgi:hypothetical protein